MFVTMGNLNCCCRRKNERTSRIDLYSATPETIISKVEETKNTRIELKDLSPDEIMKRFDVNKDGVLDQGEINMMLQKIVVTDRLKQPTLEQQTKSSSDLHISIK